eukprot:m.38528 g.38528  ORF g.38528 m.38528 type:complete len:579 (-) comp10001_c0_seq2:1209-2945(-)
MRPLQDLPAVRVAEGDILFLKTRNIVLREAYELMILLESQHEGELNKARHWEILGYLQELLDPKSEAKLSIKSEGRKSLSVLAVMKKRADVDSACTALTGKVLKLSMSATRVSVTPRSLCPAFSERWRDLFPHHFDDCLPGHRPDTVRIENLPIRWFGLESKRSEVDEAALRGALMRIALVRALAVLLTPADDPLAPPLHFAAVVQLETYEGFVALLATLHNRKLLMPGKEGRILQAEIVVSIDTSGYFSAEGVRRREQEEIARKAAAAEAVAQGERERRKQAWAEEEKRLARLKEEEKQRQIEAEQKQLEDERQAMLAREQNAREAAQRAIKARAAAARQAQLDEQARIAKEEEARLAEEARLRKLAADAMARRLLQERERAAQEQREAEQRERRERAAVAAERRRATDESHLDLTTSAPTLPSQLVATASTLPHPAPDSRSGRGRSVSTDADDEQSGDEARPRKRAAQAHPQRSRTEQQVAAPPPSPPRAQSSAFAPAAQSTAPALEDPDSQEQSTTTEDEQEEELSDGEVRDRVEQELCVRVLRKIEHLENRRKELLRERSLQRLRAEGSGEQEG